MKKFRFGWMRLSQLSEDPTNIDFDQVKQLVDTFLDAGFNYFDISFVYHNEYSENAIGLLLNLLFFLFKRKKKLSKFLINN